MNKTQQKREHKSEAYFAHAKELKELAEQGRRDAIYSRALRGTFYESGLAVVKHRWYIRAHRRHAASLAYHKFKRNSPTRGRIKDVPME